MRKPTRADLEDVFKLREWLEGGAAAVAARRINPEQIARMKKTVEESRGTQRGTGANGIKLLRISFGRKDLMQLVPWASHERILLGATFANARLDAVRTIGVYH